MKATQDVTAATGAPPGRAAKRARDPRDPRFALPYILPAQLVVTIVIFIPAVYVFWLSLNESSYGLEPTWVGLRNYAVVLSDGNFWRAMLNTVIVVAIVVHVEMLVGLGLALLFHAGLPASRLLIAAVLAPYAVSEVGAAVIWRFMLDPGIGPITHVLTAMGFDAPRWNIVPWQALGVVSLMSIWLHLPFTFIILYAGRLGLPSEVYEAAKIDGATAWQSFRKVTLPLMMPAIMVALVFRYIFAFRLFTEVWLLTQGGPARSTEVIATYLYTEAFRYYDFGVASATAWLMAVAAPLIAALYLRRMYKGLVSDV
jgi:ABC-type sugar transport systems, permease components